jgi:hypothetical protein
MQLTPTLHAKNKKPLKRPHHLTTNRNSKSVLTPSFVASAPVRQQLPQELTREDYASVSRMQAFVTWAAKRRFVKSLGIVTKKNTYRRYALHGNKRIRSRSATVHLAKRGATLVRCQASPGPSQQIFCAFMKPTVRSIWSFLTEYKRTACLTETRR